MIVCDGCNRKKAPHNFWRDDFGNFQELWITLKILRLLNLWSTTRKGGLDPENEPEK